MLTETASGRLTVHALDTAQGQPAAGLPLVLYRIDDADRHALVSCRTNADGRVDAPLLEGDALRPGIYEVVFDVQAWRGDDTGFYDMVPVRFRVADPQRHYHIPLLISPFGYTTYRGS